MPGTLAADRRGVIVIAGAARAFGVS